MKKIIIIGALIFTVGISSFVAYAETFKTPNIIPENRKFSVENKEEWYETRMEYMEEEIEAALKNGLITEEQAKAWREHRDYMNEFHSVNGFMPGGCGGNEFGIGRGHGRGMGMMRMNGWGR